MYRTGDLGFVNRAGELEFLGRTDSQVKIRGVRVEPGEAETAMLAHPGVKTRAVLAETDGSGSIQLVGYAEVGEDSITLRPSARISSPDSQRRWSRSGSSSSTAFPPRRTGSRQSHAGRPLPPSLPKTAPRPRLDRGRPLPPRRQPQAGPPSARPPPRRTGWPNSRKRRPRSTSESGAVVVAVEIPLGRRRGTHRRENAG